MTAGAAINLNITGGQKWESVWNTRRIAQPIAGKPNNYRPIGDLLCPILLHDPIIAIYCNGSGTPVDRRHWAQIIYRFQTGILTGGAAESQSPDFYRAWVGGITPFVFPRWATDYQISIRVPYWYLDFQVSVYRFTGAIADEYLEGIGRVESDIATLQSDFDAHFGL